MRRSSLQMKRSSSIQRLLSHFLIGRKHFNPRQFPTAERVWNRLIDLRPDQPILKAQKEACNTIQRTADDAAYRSILGSLPTSLAVVDGYRESTQSWRELLQQLKRHGLTVAPKLAIGDGSLGFWLALQEENGPVPQQRCWVHKTANNLDTMPNTVQRRAKELIHEMDRSA